MSTYLQGTEVIIKAAFVDDSGNPADPSTVSVEIEAGPGGARTTYTYPTGSWKARTPGSGIYELGVDTTPAYGQYTHQWIGLGAVQVPGVRTFDVEPLPLS